MAASGAFFTGTESLQDEVINPAELMDDALSRVEATYQNIDSFEVGITDVDHYFEYLGGVSRAVEKRAQARPAIYLSDTLSPQAKIRSLEETIRLETRTKTLNPKWFEGMLKHGFRGVAEIENHVANTFGWSATADAVTHHRFEIRRRAAGRAAGGAGTATAAGDSSAWRVTQVAT